MGRKSCLECICPLYTEVIYLHCATSLCNIRGRNIQPMEVIYPIALRLYGRNIQPMEVTYPIALRLYVFIVVAYSNMRGREEKGCKYYKTYKEVILFRIHIPPSRFRLHIYKYIWMYTLHYTTYRGNIIRVCTPLKVMYTYIYTYIHCKIRVQIVQCVCFHRSASSSSYIYI